VRVSIVLVLIFGMLKTMFYLRIFETLSGFVSLVKGVVSGLVPFCIFYAILLFKFSLMMAVIGF